MTAECTEGECSRARNTSHASGLNTESKMIVWQRIASPGVRLRRLTVRREAPAKPAEIDVKREEEVSHEPGNECNIWSDLGVNLIGWKRTNLSSINYDRMG